jgi:hypothetical protein
MKKAHFIFILSIISCLTALSQNIVDSNSDLIENYFRQQENIVSSSINESNSFLNKGSDIVILQLGNDNSAFILASGNNNQELKQKGDTNNYEYYSFYNSNETNIKTTQNGSNNDIQIYGQNELSKNLQISQNTNNQTIIIKNY